MSVSFDDPTYLEAVYGALLTLLGGALFAGGLTLKRTQRVLEPPDEIPAADQPALILVQGPSHVEQKEIFGPSKWTMTAIAGIYVRAEGSVGPAQEPLSATTANYLIWGIKNAFNTQPPYAKQTLGGLVYHAWIEGEVSPSLSNEQMIITVPIYLLAGPVG